MHGGDTGGVIESRFAYLGAHGQHRRYHVEPIVLPPDVEHLAIPITFLED